MDRLLPYVGKNIIKVLTGQRRVGKSYILKSVGQHIRETDLTANIIAIDLEDFAFSHITDAKSLHDEITGRMKEGCRNYIFLLLGPVLMLRVDLLVRKLQTRIFKI